MLQHLPAAAAVEPASQYAGGHVLLPGEAPHTNLILAFEYPGGWRDIQVNGCHLGPGSVMRRPSSCDFDFAFFCIVCRCVKKGVLLLLVQ